MLILFCCSRHSYEIYSGDGLATYVHMISYEGIAAPCVRSVGCVFELIYTLVDDLECLLAMS